MKKAPEFSCPENVHSEGEEGALKSARRMAAMTPLIRKFWTLLLFGLCLAPGLSGGVHAAAPDPTRLDIVMVDDRFVPDHLTFQHDVHYRLHLENHGKDTHEFTAPTFFATAKIDNPDLLNRERSEVVVQPGEAKDLFLTPGKPGTYDLRCADHDWAGMVGGITVQ
jgi:plastocyanin